MVQPTCQGYSWASVSTPPTMRVLLLATPQSQLLGAGAGEEVVVTATPLGQSSLQYPHLS